jgi:psp operon transcriptional activator
MLAQVSCIAPLDRPVLVVGERGTGKELVAARLNFLSARWDRPFVKLNCGALAETLLDSELFGHEAGAFTGAARRRLSRFEIADGGTLFLDEIANASSAVQEKILRVIEYGTFERVGGNEVHRVDVRVIGATNVDLPGLAESGRFRADLLDRLAFDVVTLPPLRERREDILLLASHFAHRMMRELKHDFFPGFTEAAEAALLAWPWPGNIRELRNVVERSVLRAAHREKPPEEKVGEIVFDAFASPFRPRSPTEPPASRQNAAQGVASGGAPPAGAADGPDPRGFAEKIRDFEASLLKEALQRHRFNQKLTAASLGLSYDQLRHHLRRHGLLPQRLSPGPARDREFPPPAAGNGG